MGIIIEFVIVFRILRLYLENKYGVDEVRKRIYVIIDKVKGVLKILVNVEGYEIFVVLDDVGGRFLVLIVVGLLLIVVVGISIDDMMKGVVDVREVYLDLFFNNNDVYKYVVVRNVLYNKGKVIELLVNYEFLLYYFNEWWK